MIATPRPALRRHHRLALHRPPSHTSRSAWPGTARYQHPPQGPRDPRLQHLGPNAEEAELIHDQFAHLRPAYRAPAHPIVLAHGLLGFDEWRLAGPVFPGIHYWRGISEALAERGVEVITAEVPRTGSIEARAAMLGRVVARKAEGRAVNIIAGLDARYMISRLQPPNTKVLSLTTIATPHRGSAFADYMFRWIGWTNIPKIYKALNAFGFETDAFHQLTMEYMKGFNEKVQDVPGVRYYSYGASLRPHFSSVFRKSHQIIAEVEGPNDGLVSVRSAKWGTYKGTLDNVSHLDLINWTNRLRWYIFELTGHHRNFNAIAFYLDIADMLAKEGL